MKQKMWAVLVHLSHNMWGHNKWGEKKYNDLYEAFSEEVWENIVATAPKSGINTIVLDVGDGIQFASHPEISIKNAWSHDRVRREIARLREVGISVIPKLNFSTIHDTWMGEYELMVGTSTYYRVCRDLIREVYELFEGPEYIHLGMDEEDARHCDKTGVQIFREGDIYFRDLRFLVDCVKDLGAKPWIWSCPLFFFPEDYKRYFDPKEIVLSPWYYNAFRPEHWTPVTSREEYVAYYNQDYYAKMNIKWVEEDPFLVRFREVALPLMKDGYEYIPCASVFNRCDWNHQDLMEYFRDNAPDDQVVGFITAPWDYVAEWAPYEESFMRMKAAKELIYGEDC